MITPLRQELSLERSPHDGGEGWMIVDPVRHAFHRIGKRALDILGGANATEAEAEELNRFLATHKLALHPPGGDPATLAREEARRRTSLFGFLVHKYLFIKIPLFDPTPVLNALAPSLGWLFTRTAGWMVVASGGLGLFLTSRQWETFTTTFWHFFSLEGLLIYGLTLAVLKMFHEFGHAFAAHRFGVEVPTIGLAFLVMFPILYTDTTSAWRVGRRERLWIDGAGMIVELSIACLALLAWSFLSDGPARSGAFFLATASWTLSLLVNLNPCMRFDGYYLISDALDVPNLQKTGFDYGRWVMREILFRLGDPRPPTPGNPRLLLLYAWTTWIYRFFLFIGIALLVHHLFPKAVGIILFTIEIAMFIALPISRELRHWLSRRAKILRSRRGRTTLTVWLALLGLFLVPWQSTVRAPAVVKPAVSTEIFPPGPALLVDIAAAPGDRVAQGDVLAILSSATLVHQRTLADAQLALARDQLARTGSSAALRDRRDQLSEEVSRARSRLAGLDARLAQLTVRAPHAGIVSDTVRTLHPGRHITAQTALMRITQAQDASLRIAVDESHTHRIVSGQAVRFIPARPQAPHIDARLTTLAPIAGTRATLPTLADRAGGPLATQEDGRLRAPVRLVDGDVPIALVREIRGTAHIRTAPESLGARIWRRVAGVLIREMDF